jgi:hypothetical protein
LGDQCSRACGVHHVWMRRQVLLVRLR